jgi:ABC-type uncharacterized transport system permease subunit
MKALEHQSRLSPVLWLLGFSAIAVWLPGRVLPAGVLVLLTALLVRSLRRAGELMPGGMLVAPNPRRPSGLPTIGVVDRVPDA